MRFIPSPNSSSSFEVSAIFWIVILMTFVATLRIYGIASRNFINTSMSHVTSNNELEHERAVGNNEQIYGSKSLANPEKIQGNILQPTESTSVLRIARFQTSLVRI